MDSAVELLTARQLVEAYFGLSPEDQRVRNQKRAYTLCIPYMYIMLVALC